MKANLADMENLLYENGLLVYTLRGAGGDGEFVFERGEISTLISKMRQRFVLILGQSYVSHNGNRFMVKTITRQDRPLNFNNEQMVDISDVDWQKVYDNQSAQLKEWGH